MARRLYSATILRRCPPWLQRSIGGRLMQSLADPIDELVERLTQGLRLRFPVDDLDPDALAAIGRERRIRRGPGEEAATYARRLLPWWDDHRTRGGPYALLRQLRAYFLATLPMRMDVVYHSGTRRWIDEDGAITRDSITWEGDGTSQWSQFWIFFHLPAADELGTDDGDTLVTDIGDILITDGAAGVVVDGAVSELVAEQFRALPREWSAAHIARITLVLLPSSTARLWNYPQPVPTWAAWGASGATWGASGSPAILTIED